MKARPSITLAVIVALASSVLTYCYLKVWTPAVDSPTTTQSASAVPPLLSTSQPALRAFTERKPWIGVVECESSVRLLAQVTGEVETVTVADQTAVDAGSLVMRLGGPYVESQRARLRANVDSLKAQLVLVDQTVSRLEGNVEVVAKNNLATALETQLRLQPQLRDAQLALDSLDEQTHITAPIAGVFTNRRVSSGQTVSAKQVVGEIIDPDHLRIVASVFAPPGSLCEGQEATAHLNKQQVVSGVIRRILPSRSSSGAAIVWIEGPNVDKRLCPGQTVSGTVDLTVPSSSLAVPESAVVYGADETPYVFIQEGATYVQQDVRLGLSGDGWVEVVSGLEPDQSVVTQGAYELFYRQFSRQFKVED